MWYGSTSLDWLPQRPPRRDILNQSPKQLFANRVDTCLADFSGDAREARMFQAD
jgi:hypothetical protein